MLNGYTVSAVIVAAGTSSRMGFDKLACAWQGKSVLERSLLAFAGHPAVDEVVLVTDASRPYVRAALKKTPRPVVVTAGGASRPESVARGLRAATGDVVAIHDAARPFVTREVIDAALAGALGAAAPAVPVKDTVKQVRDGRVHTPPRESLFAVQTPQCFFRKEYLALLAEADADVTDDCSVYERAGRCVRLTQGSYENRKITTPDDLPPDDLPPDASRGGADGLHGGADGLHGGTEASHGGTDAGGIQRAGPPAKGERHMRIGHGYDVHRLVEGRKLILGGVDVPFEKGLLGHSDADVLAHAVMDAVLGAAAMGDIGRHFPDTDERWAGADSLALMREVARMVRAAGWTVGNVDATVLCQRPKLAGHIGAMRANIAAALGVDEEAVSVKATTEEGLGFTGTGEGIAAHAVCLLTPAPAGA